MQVALNHPALVELRRRKITFKVVGDYIELEGFGKAGYPRLTAQNDVEGLLLHTRYERVVPVHKAEDIYAEAWYWYGITINRMGGTMPPPDTWHAVFVEKGWLPEGCLLYAPLTVEQWEEGEEKRKCSMLA